MLRTIIEQYGLGALSIQQIMGFPKFQEREIIDVEYVDLSDQVDTDLQVSYEAISIKQPILLIEAHADTNN